MTMMTSDVEMLSRSNGQSTDDAPMYTNSILGPEVKPGDRVQAIIDRVYHDKIPYIGIYKPGELGRETWRAVVPSPKRGGRCAGRGYKGDWESIVLSIPTRGAVDGLIRRLQERQADQPGQMSEDRDQSHSRPGSSSYPQLSGQEADNPIGIRHILNPHCDQDEGIRIVWGTNTAQRQEMKDWPRRDRMRREGKTVRAEGDYIHVHEYEGGGLYGLVDQDMLGSPMVTPMPMAMPMDMRMGIGMGMYQVPVGWDNIAWTRFG